MIGFSLRIDKRSHERITLSTISYDDFRNSNQKADQVLNLFTDSIEPSLQDDHYTLYTIGTLVYKDCWRHEALEKIVGDIRKGRNLAGIMKNTHGQFCLVIYLEGEVTIVTDKIAAFPIFIYEDDSTVHVSNVFLTVVRNNPMRVDYQAISEYCSFNYCFNAPFFKDVKLLDHGSIYNFSNKLTVIKYDNFLENLNFYKYTDLQHATEKATNIFIKNFRFLKNNREKAFVDLTGGLDSRLNSSILRSLGVTFEAGICGQQIIKEEKIAKKISDILGIKHHAHIKINDRDSFLDFVAENYEISNGIPILLHSTELLNYYHYIKKNFDIHIAGFAGSQMFDMFLPKISVTSKIRASNLIKKSYGFKNIFKDEIITELEYSKNLTQKIYKWLDRLGTRVHDHAANYFTTTVFSKFYHGSLIGAHNTILPVYVPYLEADLIRLSIQSSPYLIHDRLLERSLITHFNEDVSKVETTHGYTAHVDAIRRKTTKQKLTDFLRRLMYDIDGLRALNNFFVRKYKPQIKFAELERGFWLDQVNAEWSEDMQVFEFIDNDKLKATLKTDPYQSKLKASILYLNRLVAEINNP